MNSERLEYLEELRKENPDDPFPYYGLAMEYLRENPEKARNQLVAITDDFPEYLPAYYQLANLLYEWEEYESAFNFVEKGIVLAKESGNAKTLQELQQLRTNIEFET